MKALVLLVVGVLTAACAAATPTPQVVYVTPEPTPRVVYVTPEPTTRPTVKPTPRITPEPEPVVTVDDKWVEFLSYNAEIEGRCSLDPLTDALSYAELDYGVQAYVEGKSIERCAKDEVDWLNEHKPSACYKSLWKKMYGYWNELYKGLVDWNQWLFDFPYGTQAAFDRGNAHITEAMSMLEEAVILMGRANEDDSYCVSLSTPST